MALVTFGERAFDTDLILFDKDGTLLEFEHFWAAKTVESIERLIQGIGGNDALRSALYHTFHYNLTTQTIAEDSPIVVAANFKLVIIVATVLLQHGYGWQEAELLAERYFAPVLAEPPMLEMLRPVTDLPRLFASLRKAGIRIGVITSDDLGPTEATLNLLGVRHQVGFLACADSGYPAKPLPQAVWAACEQYKIPPERTVFVGDSTTDMETGRRANVGLRVAVLTGMMGREKLEPLADLVLGSIREMKVGA